MTDPRGTPDPKLALPEDIQHIADTIPASTSASFLRRLIGLLPPPIGPGFPNPGGGQPVGEDPALVGQQLQYSNMGFGSLPGSMIGDGTVGGSQLEPGAVTATAFASGIAPVLLVSSNPSLPAAGYPVGTIIFNTTSNLLYKNVANAWVAMVNTTDLTGTISAAQLAANSVTAGSIAANAVVAGKIAAGAISATEIAAGAITTAKLVVNGIDIGAIAQTGSITNGAIAANAISGDKIQANSIDATHIQAGAVTASDITTGTLTGITITGVNITAGGGGFDGFAVKDAGGTSIGTWNGSTGIVASTGNIAATSGQVVGANGVITQVVSGIAGAGSPVTDGQLAIDTASSPQRLYFRYSSGWHYVAQTAGVTVPAHEIRCPACERTMDPGENLIVRGDRWEQDGALHGLWIHLACAALPTGRLADEYDAAGGDNEKLIRLEGVARRLLGLRGIKVRNPRLTAQQTDG